MNLRFKLYPPPHGIRRDLLATFHAESTFLSVRDHAETPNGFFAPVMRLTAAIAAAASSSLASPTGSPESSDGAIDSSRALLEDSALKTCTITTESHRCCEYDDIVADHRQDRVKQVFTIPSL